MKSSNETVIAWVVVNMVPYHAARMNALCQLVGCRGFLVQYVDTDKFRVLSRPYCDNDLFTLITLCPGLSYDEVSWRQLHVAFCRFLAERRPDVVCVSGWGIRGSVNVMFALIARRIPIVVMSESSESDSSRRWYREVVKRSVLKCVSSAVVGGRRHAEYLARLGMSNESVFLGYDSVDNNHFQTKADLARANEVTVRRRLSLPPLYFMTCGRFEDKKNIRSVISAYRKYVDRVGPNSWPLVLVGDGALRNDLEQYVLKLKLDELVIFAGSVSYDMLPQYYAFAGVFLHMSTTEQWGLVVNEAMASGVPVIVSSVCGCVPELVTPKNGFVLAPDDVCGLASRMTEISADGTMRCEMGASSREIIREWGLDRFAAGVGAAAEYALYRRCLRSSRLRRIVDKGLDIWTKL